MNCALQEIGIKAKTTRERKISLKESFKKTELYKAGHIFLNERRSYSREDVFGLNNRVIDQLYKVQLRTGYLMSSVAFEAGNSGKGAEQKSKEYELSAFGVQIIRKAMQRLEFYEFANLRGSLPHLQSVQEFITSDKYLGTIRLEVSGLPEQIINLTPDEKLDATLQTLEKIAVGIISDKVEFKGTKLFKPSTIKATFTDKILNFMLDDEGDKEFGRSMNSIGETSYHLNLSTRDWYVFDDCFGTSEEKMLIQFIDKRYEDLKTRYSEAWLIRNEKHFKLYNFDDGRPLEPDFVLYLIGKETRDTMHYQVFVEPKGAHLLRADEWKENFLKSIKANFEIEQLFANKKYAVWGLPFYNSEQRRKEFTDVFDELLE